MKKKKEADLIVQVMGNKSNSLFVESKLLSLVNARLLPCLAMFTMKYLFFFFSAMCVNACGQTSSQKTNKTETLKDRITISVMKNKDTLILTTKTDSLNQQVTTEEIKPFNQHSNGSAAVPAYTSKKVFYLSLPAGTPTTYKDLSNIVIENLQFRNKAGNNLAFKNCTNITIRNCYFGSSSSEAISIEGGSNITIENNLFANNKSGVYALETKGGIIIRNNQFVNAKGPLPRGQYIQLDTCTGAGNIIENNKGESWPGESNPEDLISLYKSKGTAESPILVRNNIFRGGGPSSSGGGIMTGDTDGGHVIIENNILVDPGQYGIAAAGGNDIIIRHNKVFGRSQHFTNVGIYVWAQADAPCLDIEISNNNINYTKGDKGTPEKNHFWNGENCGTITGLESNKFTLTLEELKMPEHLIDFVTPVELLKIREEK